MSGLKKTIRPDIHAAVFDQPVLWIKVPKCAGSTLRHLLLSEDLLFTVEDPENITLKLLKESAARFSAKSVFLTNNSIRKTLPNMPIINSAIPAGKGNRSVNILQRTLNFLVTGRQLPDPVPPLSGNVSGYL